MTWPSARLADVAALRTGKLDSNAAVPNGAYSFFTCAQETLRIDEYAFDTEAVLLGGNNAAGIFPLKYFQGQFNAYQRTYVIETRNPNRLSTRYLYYSLELALEYFKSVSIGAATQYLTKGILDNFQVLIPPIDVQHEIVDLLSPYDDLIANNRRRIELLERSARLLFDEWFVRLRYPGHEHDKVIDGTPHGWRRGALGDFVQIEKGTNITKEIVNPGDIPVVAGGLFPAYFHDTANAFGKNVTISASGANAGFVNFYQRDIWASDCSVISSMTCKNIHYVYLLVKTRQKDIFGMQHGAAQPHVYPTDLARLPVHFATSWLIEEFEENVSYSFDLIRNLENQKTKLARSRDLLLPRLIDRRIAV